MANGKTTSRGVWASIGGVALSLLAPGAGHLLVHAKTRRVSVHIVVWASILGTAGLVAVFYPARSRADVADLVADRRKFLTVAVSLVVMAITRLWAAIDVAWAARPERGAWRKGTALLVSACLVVVGVAPMAVAADYIYRTDRAVERVFGSDDATTAQPGALPTTTAPESATSTSAGPTTTAAPFPGADRVNVLLLGGDAGEGRWSLRTDSMIVVSINPESGDTAMISVPRNLMRIPFPPGTPLAKKFPKGFPDLANAVYPYVNARPELAGGGDDAGAQAIKLGIAQLLGIPIQYYVLVDMGGFIDVVDALGGIDVNITKRVPAPGNPAEAKHKVAAYFEKGLQHLDGTLALSYSRSRKGDSDYQRMERQRCVLAGIAAAATPRALATGLGDLVDAFGDAVRTDIPRSSLPDFVELIDHYSRGGGLAAVRTLVLTPPLIQPSHWKPEKVRALVESVLTGRTAPVDGEPVTSEPSQTTTTTPATTVPAEVLTAECS